MPLFTEPIFFLTVFLAAGFFPAEVLVVFFAAFFADFFALFLAANCLIMPLPLRDSFLAGADYHTIPETINDLSPISKRDLHLKHNFRLARNALRRP